MADAGKVKESMDRWDQLEELYYTAFLTSPYNAEKSRIIRTLIGAEVGGINSEKRDELRHQLLQAMREGWEPKRSDLRESLKKNLIIGIDDH